MSRYAPSATCAATQCSVPVKRGMLMCRDHWFALPKPLRDEVWRTWRAAFRAEWHPNGIDAEARLECINAYREAVTAAVDYLHKAKAEVRP